MNIAYFLLPKSRIAYLYDDFTFRQGLEKMRNRGYTAIPVITRDGRYVGTVSEGDFLWRLLDTDDPSMKKAEELALKMAGMLSLVAKIFAPLVWLLTASTNFWLRRFGIDPEEEEETVSEEEIRLLLAEGREQGTIPTEETEMIQNVFGFDDIAVGTICTHRRRWYLCPRRRMKPSGIGFWRRAYIPIIRSLRGEARMSWESSMEKRISA